MGAALPIVAMAAMGIGTGMSVFGAIQSGRQEAAAAKAQAKMSELQSKEEGRSAGARANYLREQAVEHASYQKAAYAASGVNLQGSPMLVMASTIRDSQKDVSNLLKESNAKRLSYKMQGDMYKSYGSFAKKSSYWQAGSSLLTGVGSGIVTWKSTYGKDTAPTTKTSTPIMI